MSKKRHREQKGKRGAQSFQSGVTQELNQIDSLIENGELTLALEKLRELAQRARYRVDVFESLFLVALKLNDSRELLIAAVRLSELEPSIPAHVFNLVGAYKQAVFPALAVETVRILLNRWPDLDLKGEFRQQADQLQSYLEVSARRWRLPEGSWLEILLLHERVQVAQLLNRHEESCRLATQLISLAPNFTPAYNNRSLSYYSIGRFDEAIADEGRALEIDPTNAHALSNLTRFLRLTNRLAEAREFADRLKAIDSTAPDVWAKKVEAFAFLADDTSLLQIADQAEKAGAMSDPHADPLLFDLTAVAAARMGDERKAQRLWQEAIKRFPYFSHIREHFHNLDKAEGERDGAWPFELAEWISPHLVETFKKMVGDVKVIDKTDSIRHFQAAADRFVRNYPFVTALIPVLLERGDPFGRQFARWLAQLVNKPETLAYLKEFVQSPNGPDKSRFECIQVLEEAGIIQRGQRIQFWDRGKQIEMEIMNFNVDDIPYEGLPPKARDHYTRGTEALKQGNLDLADQFLLQGLREAPNSAAIKYNLAILEIQRGNTTNARSMLQAITQEHPKYPFALTQLAMIETANNRVDEAKNLLKSAGSLEHYHYDEFVAYCKAQICFSLVHHGGREAAQEWLEMWEKMLPDDPRIDRFRPLVRKSLLGPLLAKSILAELRE